MAGSNRRPLRCNQVVVDGIVLQPAGLELDESLLTGESDPVAKGEGDEVLSGSFVAAGSGFYKATRIGVKAYAAALAEDARRFSLVHSELRSGIDRVIKLVGWAMLPTAALLLYSQLDAHAGLKSALRGTVAGVVAMVPEGLVLLTSMAFALGVIRLARRRTLVQELPAVETLARVNVICLDKTGTITYGDLGVVDLRLLAEEDGERAALGALASAEPSPNATLRAIAEEFPSPDHWRPIGTVPFSSSRKWSAATFDGRGSWVLGAPELLLPSSTGTGDRDALQREVEREAASGRRVLLLARAARPPQPDALDELEPRALLLLADRVREDAPATLRYFAEQGVDVKIISGDHPRTVAMIAGAAGVAQADRAVDARTIDTEEEIESAVATHTVFGRVTPHQKRLMIKGLQRRGHVVAMTGDGVNDVLALKDADIGIAMGSGASASRAVAKLVLLDGSFAVLPQVVAEGRQVINNVERVANLFLTKTVYSMLLALGTGIAGLPFPFLPRHLTLIGSVTIGMPGFLLALAPNRDVAHSGFVKRVLQFAVPAGLFGAAATFIAYYESHDMAQVSLAESKTAATIALLVYGLLVLWHISRPLGRRRFPLVGTMTLVVVAVVTLPILKDFFNLDPPPLTLFALTLVSVAIAFQTMLVVEQVVKRRTG